jgi:hypothetical protein
VGHHLLEQHFPPESPRYPVQDDLIRGRRKAKTVGSVDQKLSQVLGDMLIFFGCLGMVVLENNNGHLTQLSAEGPPLFRALLASLRE